MVHLKAHVICQGRTASGNVDIGPLAHGKLLEHQVIPIHVRIDIRIHSARRVRYLSLAVTRHRRRVAAQQSLVVSLHVGGAVSIFHHIDRLKERLLHRCVDSSLGVFLAGLGRDYHDTISSPRSVDRCG